MSELRKANTDLDYFLTITVVGWIDIFTRNRYNEIIMNSHKYCQLNKALDIFVVCNNAQPYPFSCQEFGG